MPATRSRGAASGTPSSGMLRRTPYSSPMTGRMENGQRIAKYQSQTNANIIDEPDLQQAAVVNTIHFYKNERKMRSMRTPRAALSAAGAKQIRLLAPLGTDDQAFHVKQFEPVFTIAEHKDYNDLKSNPALGVGVQPSSTTAAFGSVNGLIEGTPLKFLGISTTNQDATPNSEKLDVGTVNTFGVQTTWNSGPNRLRAFAPTFFDPRPYASMGPDGQLTNHAVLKGHPESKFRPSIYSLTDTDACAMYLACLREMKKEMDKHARVFDATSQATFEKALDKVVEDLMQDRPPSLPLPVYLKAHAYSLVIMRLENGASSNEKVRRIAKLVYNNIVKKMEEDRDSLNASMGQTSATQAPLFPIFKKSMDNPDVDARVEMLIAMAEIEAELVFNFREWLRRHYMGTCQVDTPPGRSFPLLIHAGPFCG